MLNTFTFSYPPLWTCEPKKKGSRSEPRRYYCHSARVAPSEQISKAEYSVCISGRRACVWEAFFSFSAFVMSPSPSRPPHCLPFPSSSSFCFPITALLEPPPGKAQSTSTHNCSMVSYLSWHFYRSAATVTQNAAFRPQMGSLHFPPSSVSHTTSL